MIDVELARARSLDQFQQALRRWLRVALIAQNPEGFAGLDIHGRGRYLDGLEAAWDAARAGRPERGPFAALDDLAEPDNGHQQ